MGQTGRLPPIRVALVRFWIRRHLLRLPVPLTGAAALREMQAWESGIWTAAFLRALAAEAADDFDLLVTMERAWLEARRAIALRRKTSHAAAAMAAPVISATSLARILGIAVKNALRLLDELCAAEIAVEVTHRSKRRLLGLVGLAPLRDVVRPPYRPDQNRGRERPRHEMVGDEGKKELPSLPPLKRRAFDYGALEEAKAHPNVVVRRARQELTPAAATDSLRASR